MRIKSEAASIAWKLALVGCAAYGLLNGSGILAGHPIVNFLHLFKNVSANASWAHSRVAVAICLLCILIFGIDKSLACGDNAKSTQTGQLGPFSY